MHIDREMREEHIVLVPPGMACMHECMCMSIGKSKGIFVKNQVKRKRQIKITLEKKKQC
jgi:hypothetical protein